MASPVSKKGLEFLKEVTIVDMFPSEYGDNLPPDVTAIFIGTDGIVMPIGANQGLQ